MKKNKLSNPRLFTIRAYCSKCKKLILESNKLNRKELLLNWDKAVLEAPGLQCKNCQTAIPNFYIYLRIYNSGSNLEFKPNSVLPKPKHIAEEFQDLLKIMSN